MDSLHAQDQTGPSSDVNGRGVHEVPFPAESYWRLTADGGREVISLGGVSTGRLPTLQRMAPQPCAQGQ